MTFCSFNAYIQAITIVSLFVTANLGLPIIAPAFEAGHFTTYVWRLIVA
jgi:hypothetical protein